MASHIAGYRKVAADLRESIWNPSVEYFIVPELRPAVKFLYASHKALGVDTVPVLVGPVSYLLSKPAKGVEESFSLLSLLGKILPIYKEVITELKEAGASWIQFDEPTLVMDLESHKLHAFTEAYSALESTLSGLNVLIETCFADIPAEQYKTLTSLKGVTAFGFDVVRGRNIWANDLAASLSTLETLEGIVGKDKLVVSTSCSLLHTAVDLVNETKPDKEIKPWLAFAVQKVVEVTALARALAGQKDEEIFYANAAAQASRKSSPRGQRCGGPKLFDIKETKGDRDPIDNTEDEIGRSPPAISRSPIPKTMRVKITVNSREYIALIDTGSHLNFLHPRVAGEVGLKIINDDPIEVSIADGSKMYSEGSCPEFKFGIQGGQFATQAYILQVDEFDVILGIEWLLGLGPIKNWDFASLKMEFTQGGKTIQIKGMDTEESEVGCSTEEITDGINMMLAVLETIQVNPDGGLKTRKYTEVKPTLKNKLLRSLLVSAK